MNPNYSTFTSADLLNAVVGFFMPPLVAIVVQTHWPKWVKALFAACVCLSIGGAIAWVRGDFVPTDLLRNFLTLLIVSGTTFQSFWKPLGIAPWLEKATDVTTTPTPDTPANADTDNPQESAPEQEDQPEK